MALRTAVIGSGGVSDIHLDGLEMNPRTELVAVCDIDETQAREKAAAYDIEYYTDAEEMFRRASPDWVNICTPVQTHYDLASAAVDEGIATLIEKPAVETVEEAEKLQEESERAGVTVSVVHSALFGPGIRRVKQIINSGMLGPIRGIDTMYVGLSSPDDNKRGVWVYDLPGGEFEEGLPHPIYLTLGLGGYPRSREDISTLTNLSRKYDLDFDYDMAQVQYISREGGLCSIKMLSVGQRQKLVAVHGEHASLFYDTHTRSVQLVTKDYSQSPLTIAEKAVYHSGSLVSDLAHNGAKMVRSKLDDSWKTQRDMHPHYELFDKMATAIERDGKVPGPLEQATWTTVIMEEMRQTAGATNEQYER